MVWREFTSLIILLQFFQACSGQRLVGAQGGVVADKLWLTGGSLVENNGSTFPTLNLTTFDLTAYFDARYLNSTTAHGREMDIPNVSHGTQWSDMIKTRWLFGGPSLWRFTVSEGAWKEVMHAASPSNLPLSRSGGVGLNVPLRSKGYYLGGHASNNSTNYYHSTIIFDMGLEKLTSIDLPHMIPIISPSMVFFDTGMDGVLIVFGGKTEYQGVLSFASLETVYILDLASRTWVQQPTTDTLGRQDVFYGAYDQYGPGIPSARFNACSVAGTSPDHTSFNVYLFGGQNDTDTPGDMWALSFPACTWIRLTTTDIHNNPKTGSTCNLIHERYVLMYGGCWMEDGNTCLSYGYNPLLYVITPAVAGPGSDWIWQFNPNISGYYVPQQITQVIGGGGWSPGAVRSPLFTTWNDSVLESVFTPTPSNFVSKVILAWELVLPLILSLPVVMALRKALLQALRPAARGGSRLSTSSTPPWRPFILREESLVFLIMTTAALIFIVAALWGISSMTDPNYEDWNQSIESDGIWSTTRWNSSFTPARGTSRPFRGLTSIYMDLGTSGKWSRHNVAQRMTTGPYILWTYVPSLIFVLYGVLWQVVDGETKRLEKYRQLQSMAGCTAERTLRFEYHEFWSPLAILQAFRYRQWAVVCTSTGYVIAAIVLPNLQNYVFAWEIFAGTNQLWGGQQTHQVGYMVGSWTVVLLALLALNMSLAIGLYLCLEIHPLCLYEDPRGVAFAVSILLKSEAELKQHFREFQIERNVRLLLQHDPDGTAQLQVLRPSPATSRATDHLMQHMKSVLVNVKQWVTPPATTIKKRFEVWLSRYIHLPRNVWTWIDVFSLLLLIFWNALLVSLLVAAAWVFFHMIRPVQMQGQNYQLPWSSNVYLIAGVFVQSLYQLLERCIRAVTIPIALIDKPQPPSVLYEDWSNTAPVIDVFQAVNHGRNYLAFTLFGTIVSIAYTIFLGSLQVSASFFGATTFQADFIGVVVVIVLNSYLLGIGVTALVGYVRYVHRGMGVCVRGRIGRRLGVQLALCLWSVGLQQDMRQVGRRPISVPERISALDYERRQYELREVRDHVANRPRYQIERV